MNSTSESPPHISVLDGWRGCSILLVLAAHLLPLGPKAERLNDATGMLGMVLFFILSGFLITSFLLKKAPLTDFLLRRLLRILPLAWLYLLVALAISSASLSAWIGHFFFYANLPPKSLLPLTDHMWSLCVEMQFYLGIALLVALLRGYGLLLLPLLGLLCTALRVWDQAYVSTVTPYRLDEILAGCTLALLYHGHLGARCLHWLQRGSTWWWLLLLALPLSCLHQTQWLNYARPYLAAALVGSTLCNAETPLARFLQQRWLAWLAGISYALYVLHPLLAASWLGSGDVIEKYLKRPLLFAVLFALAYFSTHFYEHRWIAWGKKISRQRRFKHETPGLPVYGQTVNSTSTEIPK